MSTVSNSAYWVLAPGRGALQPAPSPDGSRPSLAAAFSAISGGTERLVGRGEVPAFLTAKMACRGMEGTFPFPVKYGYSWVGHRPDGQAVFTMHPHQRRIEVPADDTLVIPPDLPLPRATLLPNLETALNAWWDASLPDAARFMIVGGGIVGVLLAFVAWKQTGEPATVSEIDPLRRAELARLPWMRAVEPRAVDGTSFALIFHTSGSGEGLQWSIDHLGFEGTVIELSWYGARSVSLDLGAGFHYDRKRIMASQVSTVAPSKRGPGDFRRRVNRVLELLADDALDRLPGPFIPFHELPAAMSRLYRGEHLGLHPVVSYASTP